MRIRGNDLVSKKQFLHYRKKQFLFLSVSHVPSHVPSHVSCTVSRAGWLYKNKSSRELGARPLALFCGRLGFLQERTHDSLYKGTLVQDAPLTFI